MRRSDLGKLQWKWRAARSVFFVLLCAVAAGCAGGMPSIPDNPENILAKGDEYFKRKKCYQSMELYKAFLARYAGHERSDYAQYRMAESYFCQEEYALAAVEFRILVTNYGYSEYVDEGFFNEALCNYNQSPKTDLDQTKAFEALSQFQQFVQVYKQSPLVPEANKYIALIQEKLARKELDNAVFYFGRKKYLSALIYLDKIIENYPNNESWVRAKYLKAKILYVRGEREDEAVELLQQVMQYPENLRVKKEAEILLKEIRKG
jgi:outer membrane protein assembly factor BamD